MPTLLIDEGDFKASDETSELIKFINLGFEKGKKLFNCDKNDPSKLEFFDPYCPKIITRRKQFIDQATEARCLTETMRQTTRKICPLLTSKFYKKQTELRNKLLQFRFDHYNKIDVDKIVELDLGDVEPRIKQAMLGFTTLFANIPEVLDSFKLFVKKYNSTVIDERANSYDGLIINTIIDLVIEGSKHITPKDILDRIQSSTPKATTRSIGKHLAQLKLKTKPTKIDGVSKKIVPLDEGFLNVCKRYCCDEERIEKVSLVSLVSTVTSTSKDGELLPNNVYNNKIEEDVTNETNETNVTEEEIKSDTKTPLKWEKEAQAYHNCSYPNGDTICGDSPCNEFDGLFYCKEHFMEVQK